MGMSTTKKIVKDPVCGVDVDSTTTGSRTAFKGKTYFFCSTHCKNMFGLNPKQYWSKAPEPAAVK